MRPSRRGFLRDARRLCVGAALAASAGAPDCRRQRPRQPRRLHRRHRRGRPGCMRGTCPAAPTNKQFLLEEMGCGVAFFDYDNDGWLDIFLVNGTQLRPAGARQPAHQLPVPQQSRRHVHRRHAQGRADPLRLGPGLLRRRLRQRRLRRSVRHLLGPQRALSQQRRRHVHRRLREGRRRRVADGAGARAAASSTTTATVTSICSSPTT